MGSIPSGYIQLPLWVLVLIWGLVVTFIGYIWHNLGDRVKELEKSEKEKTGAPTNDPAWIKQDNRVTDLEREELNRLRKQIEDPYLTYTKHMAFCSNITVSFKEFVNQKFEAFEKIFNEYKTATLADIKDLKDGSTRIWDRVDDLVKLNGSKKKE